MGKERLSERTIAKRLGKIQKQLDGIAGHLLRSRIGADDLTAASSATTESDSGFDGLHNVLDQLRARIDEHLDSWDQERDRLESRLHTLERAAAEKAPLIQELQAREAAFKQAAQKASTAPSRAAPVDYAPVLTAAIQLMRDVGVCVIERCWTQEQKPSPPSQKA